MKRRKSQSRRRRNAKLVCAPDIEYGLIEIAVSDPDERSILAEYWNAVQIFLDTGDDEALTEFRGELIETADGELVPFVTALDELERLGFAGLLSFESLYVEGA